MTSYPTPAYRRTALAPGVLGAIAALAGLALIGGGGYTIVRFVLSIVALIVIVFTWQAKKWWWLPFLAAIAVLWNPIVPLDFAHDQWLALHYVAAIVFLVVGIAVRVPNPEDRNRR